MIRLAFLLALTASLSARSEPVDLFNGRNLEGWVNVNCAPETWSVKDGVIHCTGHPTGALRTTRQYENYILELDWRHLSSGGNSGIFIWATPVAAPGVPFLRSIEVQVLDNGYNASGKNQWYTTHGDVFPIHGSSMAPFGRHNGMRSFPGQERSNSSPEWNHYRIVCSNGVIRLSVNGAEVSGGEKCNYRKGYLGLESEGGPVEFRNIRLTELPSTHAPDQETAPKDQGWRSLFTGLDLRGWTTNAATASRWSVRGERLIGQAGVAGPETTLLNSESFRDAEFIVDCQPPKSGQPAGTPTLVVRTSEGQSAEVALAKGQPGAYRRYVLTVRGSDAVLLSDGAEIVRVPFPRDRGGPYRFGLNAGRAGSEFMNIYVRDL